MKMNSQEIINGLQVILSQITKDREVIVNEDTLIYKDMQLDSFKLVAFIVEVENLFNADLDYEVFSKIEAMTAGELAQYIESTYKVSHKNDK